MKKKNDFMMWLFSESVSRALNWFAVILIIIWFGYRLAALRCAKELNKLILTAVHWHSVKLLVICSGGAKLK